MCMLMYLYVYTCALLMLCACLCLIFRNNLDFPSKFYWNHHVDSVCRNEISRDCFFFISFLQHMWVCIWKISWMYVMHVLCFAWVLFGFRNYVSYIQRICMLFMSFYVFYYHFLEKFVYVSVGINEILCFLG